MWRLVWSLVAPWRGLLSAILLLMAAGTGVELVPPLVVRRVVDGNLATGEAAGLLTLALVYFGARQAANLLHVLQDYAMAVVAQGALLRLRVRLFQHLQNLPIAYYDRTPLGDVISRCTADVETVETLFAKLIAGPIENVVRLVSVAAAMVVLSPPLALVAALILPILVWITNTFRLRIRAAEGANRRAVGLLNTHLQETLGGVEVIRAFGREQTFVARFRQALREAVAAFNNSTLYSSLYPPATGLVAAGAIALLLWAGAQELLAGLGVTLGTLTSFILLFRSFFTVVQEIGDDWQTVQGALSGLERIQQVLEENPHPPGPLLPAREKGEEIFFGTSSQALPGLRPGPDGAMPQDPIRVAAPPQAPRGAPALRTLSRLVEMREVVFGYAERKAVLRGVSFEVRAGEHVALVGRTGAGKSSVLNLLGGLYAPWSGTVRVAGRDPCGLDPAERPRVLGVVPQVVQLFSGTVRENLTLDAGSPSENGPAEDAALERALVVVGADAIVRTLPQGYDTPLAGGGRGSGVQLSSGQRQLLSLARALVHDPVVLLLDEATAAIDGASDAAFRAALREALLDRGRAVVTVAHRLSTAREADRVIVLDAGRIVEEGAPEALVAAGGRFAALVALEDAGWAWDGEVAGGA
jgi:ATP-binding cassette subfamily B multidrug efflux pump